MLFKYGDVAQLGNHRLACGDSADEWVVKKLVQGDKIKSIICDPPYGVDYVSGKNSFWQGIGQDEIEHKPIKNDAITSDSQYFKFSSDWLETIKPHLADKNSIYSFSADKTIFPLRDALIVSGFHFGQLLVWVKNNSVLGRLDYLPQHEMIIYGWFGTHDFRKSKDKSLLYCPKPNKSKLHPTMKPIPLLRRLILNSTNIDDYVFDGFGGSGSTLLACEQTQRKCLMVELDPEYCEVICQRFETLTGIKPEIIEDLNI